MDIAIKKEDVVKNISAYKQKQLDIKEATDCIFDKRLSTIKLQAQELKLELSRYTSVQLGQKVMNSHIKNVYFSFGTPQGVIDYIERMILPITNDDETMSDGILISKMQRAVQTEEEMFIILGKIIECVATLNDLNQILSKSYKWIDLRTIVPGPNVGYAEENEFFESAFIRKLFIDQVNEMKILAKEKQEEKREEKKAERRVEYKNKKKEKLSSADKAAAYFAKELDNEVPASRFKVISEALLSVLK